MAWKQVLQKFFLVENSWKLYVNANLIPLNLIKNSILFVKNVLNFLSKFSIFTIKQSILK